MRLRVLRSGDRAEGRERGGQRQRADCVPVRLRMCQRGRMQLWLHRRGLFVRVQLTLAAAACVTRTAGPVGEE